MSDYQKQEDERMKKELAMMFIDLLNSDYFEQTDKCAKAMHTAMEARQSMNEAVKKFLENQTDASLEGQATVAHVRYRAALLAQIEAAKAMIGATELFIKVIPGE